MPAQFRFILITLLCLTGVSCSNIITTIIESQAENRLPRNIKSFGQNKLHLLFCGTGTPMPDPARAQSCAMVIAGERVLVVDAGDGSVRRTLDKQMPISAVTDILITHWHSDHFADLAEMINVSWQMGRRHAIKIHGPKGAAEIVAALSKAYQLEHSYRLAHHGPATMPPEIAGGMGIDITLPADGHSVVLQNGDLTVTAFAVDHRPISPAFGFRIEYKNKTIVFSGDTSLHPGLLEKVAGADILVSEVMNKVVVAELEEIMKANGRHRMAKIMADIPGYHIGVAELGRLAARAKVGKLVVTHAVPGPGNWIAMDYLYDSDLSGHYKGEIIYASDGTEISL